MNLGYTSTLSLTASRYLSPASNTVPPSSPAAPSGVKPGTALVALAPRRHDGDGEDEDPGRGYRDERVEAPSKLKQAAPQGSQIYVALRQQQCQDVRFLWMAPMDLKWGDFNPLP